MALPNAYAISPVLNSPRINDRVTCITLAGGPKWLDTLEYCPDLKNINMLSEKTIQVWTAAPCDSTSSMTISIGRESVNLTGEPSNLTIQSHHKPGITKYYNESFNYGVADTLKQTTYKASGHISSIGDFTTEGIFRQHLSSGLRIVSTDGDTIDNVECLITDKIGQIVYNYTDTCMHQANQRDWYAPGYRYPILSMSYDLITSASGDTIDSKTEWIAILPSVQETEIKDDHSNEYLRDQIKERNLVKLNKPEPKSFNTTQNERNKNITFSDDNSQINITHMPVDPQFTEYLLCDIFGRVYYHDLWPCEQPSVILSLNFLPAGTYLINIDTEGGPINYKIIR